MVAQCNRSYSGIEDLPEQWRQPAQWFDDLPAPSLLRVGPDAHVISQEVIDEDDGLRNAVTVFLGREGNRSRLAKMAAISEVANLGDSVPQALYDVNAAQIVGDLPDLDITSYWSTDLASFDLSGANLVGVDFVELAKTVSDLLAKLHGSTTSESTAIRIAGLLIPVELEAIAREIGRSRYLLEDDWDGEGTDAIDLATWERATRFLATSATAYYERTGSIVPACRIGGGPDGSLDLHWRLSARELLLNIDPAEPNAGSFYGDDGAGKHQFKGTLDPAAPAEWLMAWILGR